jgi:hypothetical protein
VAGWFVPLAVKLRLLLLDRVHQHRAQVLHVHLFAMV